MLINPILIFYIASGLIISGCLYLSTSDNLPLEVFWIAFFLVLLTICNRIIRYKRHSQAPSPKIDLHGDVDLFCVAILALVGTLILIRGAPLFAENPNIARVAFFADGQVLAKSFSLLPAVIAIAVINFANRGGIRCPIYGMIASTEIIMAGNKAAMINICVPIIAGFWAAQRRVPFKWLIFGGATAVALTLFLFTRVANDSEMSQSAWTLLWTRLSELNATGLRICFDNAGHLNADAATIAFQSVIDRLSGHFSGYPVSTGRYITALYYNYLDFYDPLWELTVTGYCDAYLFGGSAGLATYCILMAATVCWTIRKMATAKTLIGKGLYILLFSQLLAIYVSGNIAAQLLGFIGQTWILAFAIICIARLAATRWHDPSAWASDNKAPRSQSQLDGIEGRR